MNFYSIAMKRLLITPVFLLGLLFGFSQQSKQEYKINTIAFYNLENLFDTINDPNTRDENSPILEIKANRSNAYWSKIENMEQRLEELTANGDLKPFELKNEHVLNS